MKSIALVFAALLAGASALLAHHSFAAEYDDQKPIKVQGTVMKVEWQNPHIWYYIDAKGDDGKVISWAFSGGAPGQLMRRGIYKSSIQVGSVVTVEGFRAKDGSNNAFGAKLTYPDGRMVLTSNQEDRSKQ